MNNSVLPIHFIRVTPPGRGAVATLRVEGPGASGVVHRVFKANRKLPPGADPPADKLVHGTIGYDKDVREEVVVRFCSARAIEIHCHGGMAALGSLESQLQQLGCHRLTWQEWVQAQEDDPIRAAAHIALADATTERTARILLDQYQGALRSRLNAVAASLAVDDTTGANQQIEELLAWAPVGRHLITPWRVVLAGPPNAGKSSLMNAILGYQRSIVHTVAGTTRDVVTATTAMEGWPLELADTAGLRQSEHPIELVGVQRTRQELSTCDLVLLILDSSHLSSKETNRPFREAWPDALVVQNKCDLPRHEKADTTAIATSALTGEGITELLEAIVQRLVPKSPLPGTAIPFTTAQVAQIEQACEAVVRGNLSRAISLLTQDSS